MEKDLEVTLDIAGQDIVNDDLNKNSQGVTIAVSIDIDR